MEEECVAVCVGWTDMLQLAVRGDWTALETILHDLEKAEAEISQVDEDSGLSLLMIATRENRLSIVERLLELDVNPEEKTKDGRTALHIASAHSSDDIVNCLAKKLDPDTPGGSKAQLPLHYAASRRDGSVSVVHTLLKLSNKNARLTPDKDGYIPLVLAIKAGHVGIVKELLSHQAEQQLETKTKENGDMAVHICCRRKDLEMAKVLLEFSANLDSQNDEGQTPLHIAACEGDQAMLKFFYYRLANPNIADKLDRHPIHIAAEQGHSNVVEILTEKFKSNVLERTKDGSTLLHIASERGHPSTALAFVKKGVPLHMPNKSGALCLHVAAKCGHTSVVEALLLKGVRVDVTTKDGLTALHIAVQNCRPQVVQMLLGFGAQVELKGGKAQETPLHMAARVKEGEKVADMLLKSGAEVDTVEENGETAMHIAACHGNLQMVKALVEEGADLTWRSKAEETPLHAAARHCQTAVVEEILKCLTSQKGRDKAELCVRQENQKGETALHLAAEIQKDMLHTEDEDVLMIRILMEHNADITAVTKEMGENPVHYCARVGNVAVLQEMLSNMPSSCLQMAINMQGKTGRSPLLLAAERGHTAVVQLLLQNNARMDVFDEEGKAALHLAAEQGCEDIADILLSYKAFVNAKTKLGLTPLHLSAQNGLSHLIRLLITTHQAITDALSLSKQTPLHLAAISGHLDVCNSLLNLGADITATDIYGQTPLHLAAQNNHSDIVKLFLKCRPELATLANVEGASCIHIASAKGSVAVIQELLSFRQGGLHNKANGSCPLHLAAAGGHSEVVKVLLNAGASATEEDSEGMTAVHLAAQNGHIHVLEELKANVSLKICSSKTGLTALHVAAYFGQVEFVREILTEVPATICSESPSRDATRKLQSLTESEYTPLHLAAQSGHENVVRLLLNSPGVQADAETIPGRFTPLHLAAQNGHTAVVGLLLSKSSSLLHLQEQRGCTCLHLASGQGHITTVRVLLCHGVEISHKDKMGCTALHYAAQAGYLEVVRFLVESGASVQAECDTGYTPLQYAAMENHLTTVSFLLRRPDNNTLNLLKDRKFLCDLMVCGKLNDNIPLEDLVLYSEAPLITAVHLSRALSLASLKEKVRFVDLRAAARHCEIMASDLLNLAATTEGLDAPTVLKAIDCRGTSVLNCLIEGRQKNVVSNPAVQTYLTEVWHGNLEWALWKVLLLFFCLLFCPPLWLALSLPLKNRFNTIPIVKLMTHLVSHIFLLLLFILILIVYPLMSPPYATRLIPGWCEWVLLIWLCGMLVSELRQSGERTGWGMIRVFLLLFSGAAIICHLLAVYFQLQPKNFFFCLYIRNVLLAVSMTLGFVQLLEFLMFHHLFGPWVIIIKNLMKDLCRFAFILLLFHTTFSLSFTAICQHSNSGEILQSNHSENRTNSERAEEKTVWNMLFFALFGLTEEKEVRCSKDTEINELTRVVFGIYLVVTVIVLLNLLIAMMSNTYQRIQDQSDTEWKFGRAILIRDMNYKSEIPSPFNLFTCLMSLCKHKGKLCSMKSRDPVREEKEDAEVLISSRSLNRISEISTIRWYRENQTTEILSEGSPTVMPHQEGQVLIQNVTDWKVVVQRFLTLRGQKDRVPADTGSSLYQ